VKEKLGQAAGLTPKELGIVFRMRQEGYSLDQISQEFDVELQVLEQFLPQETAPVIKETVVGLETQIDALFQQGKRAPEIARILGINERAVLAYALEGESKTYFSEPSEQVPLHFMPPPAKTKKTKQPQPTKALAKDLLTLRPPRTTTEETKQPSTPQPTKTLLKPQHSPAIPLSSIRPSIGSVPITASTQFERLLRKGFAEIDANGDKMLTFDEIYNFLCKRSGQSFDKRLCQKLFDKMDKDRDSVVNTDEFILCYVDAEKVYQIRIDELQEQIQDSTAQMEDAQNKMVASSQVEEPNPYGIMKGSVLTVKVIKAQNLLPMDIGRKSDPFVILSCENQQIETRYISIDQNPVWDETFTFQIQKGTEDLSVIVMDHDVTGRHDFEGQVEIPLQSIADQMKHEQFFELQGRDPSEPWQGRIQLTLQWIWSKTRYWETLVNQWRENIEFDQDDLNHLQDLHIKLRKPFAFMEQDV
jgi:Ca2+-binding EF-hand superfamily protein